MSIKNLLRDVHDAIGTQRRLGQTTNLLRLVGKLNHAVLVTANARQADRLGRGGAKCVAVHSLPHQCRRSASLALYFDNHTVGDLARQAVDEIEEREADIRYIRRDLQNMIQREYIAVRQIEVLTVQLREYQNAVIRLSNALRPPPIIVEGEDPGEGSTAPGSLAELLQLLEREGHIPPVSGTPSGRSPRPCAQTRKK